MRNNLLIIRGFHVCVCFYVVRPFRLNWNRTFLPPMGDNCILLIFYLHAQNLKIIPRSRTPALTTLSKAELKDDEEFEGLPFGIIFSTFMVCCMAGSSIFSIAMEKMKPEQLAVIVFGVASFSFLMVSYSNSATSTFLSMNLFEVCVGMYFPSMGTMKGMIVPEDKRAAIYNLFRIPLNFIVLFSLLTDLTPHVSFVLCGSMMVVATMLQWRLKSRRIMA